MLNARLCSDAIQASSDTGFRAPASWKDEDAHAQQSTMYQCAPLKSMWDEEGLPLLVVVPHVLSVASIA